MMACFPSDSSDSDSNRFKTANINIADNHNGYVLQMTRENYDSWMRMQKRFSHLMALFKVIAKFNARVYCSECSRINHKEPHPLSRPANAMPCI